ncbi:MAG: metal-dependent transcriptional regulator [Candidatus Bathyarchaeota archaeon]|nr:metal-dependent transcriptional regulator [Candidatus Bathyarchaeota archaeon]
MSESVEEYLEAIYHFNEKGELAKNNEIAERLHVAPPSVTQMIKRLAEEGMIIYEPYRGVTLTGVGTARAQNIVRKHRLLEVFLYNILGLEKEKIHLEACRLEHNISDEATAALCKALNKPKICPDDDRPIPPCILEISSCSECKTAREKMVEGRLLTQLFNLKKGEKAVVTFIRGARVATQRIMDLGLYPGTVVSVVNSAPFNGPFEISVRGETLALVRGLAEKIFVELEGRKNGEVHPHGPRHFV